MKLISHEYLYEEEIVYIKEKDAFESLLLVTIEDETSSILECEIKLRKAYSSKEWRMGSIYIFGKPFTREYILKLREWLREELNSVFQYVQKKEEQFREKYKNIERIQIVEVEKRAEYIDERSPKGKKYFQKYRMRLSPFQKYFSIYIMKSKTKDHITVKLEQKQYIQNELNSLWYPGWRSDLKQEVLQYWINTPEDVLEPTEKRRLYENTVQMQKNIRESVLQELKKAE